MTYCAGACDGRSKEPGAPPDGRQVQLRRQVPLQPVQDPLRRARSAATLHQPPKPRPKSLNSTPTNWLFNSCHRLTAGFLQLLSTDGWLLNSCYRLMACFLIAVIG